MSLLLGKGSLFNELVFCIHGLSMWSQLTILQDPPRHGSTQGTRINVNVMNLTIKSAVPFPSACPAPNRINVSVTMPLDILVVCLSWMCFDLMQTIRPPNIIISVQMHLPKLLILSSTQTCPNSQWKKNVLQVYTHSLLDRMHCKQGTGRWPFTKLDTDVAEGAECEAYGLSMLQFG